MRAILHRRENRGRLAVGAVISRGGFIVLITRNVMSTIRPHSIVPGTTVYPELAALDAKIDALLPPRYQGCFEQVPPTSMGTASLKYDPSGQVAWNDPVRF